MPLLREIIYIRLLLGQFSQQIFICDVQNLCQCFQLIIWDKARAVFNPQDRQVGEFIPRQLKLFRQCLLRHAALQRCSGVGI